MLPFLHSAATVTTTGQTCISVQWYTLDRKCACVLASVLGLLRYMWQYCYDSAFQAYCKAPSSF